MAYKNRWLIENRVVFVEFSGDLSLEDLQGNDTDMLRYMETGIAPIHVICTISNFGRFPTQFTSIARSSRQYLKHSSMGWLIFAGIHNSFVIFMGKLVANASQLKFKQAANIEEAFGLLQRVDLTLSAMVIEGT